MSKKIAVMPGDGIGVEVTNAGVKLIEALPVDWELRVCEGGWGSWLKNGDPIPDASWELIKQSECLLLGATTSKPKREAELELSKKFWGQRNYVSPIVQLRQKLDLFANVRPLTDFQGEKFSMVVIRENTEGLYSGLDFGEIRGTVLENLVKTHPNVDLHGQMSISATIRLQTEFAWMRLLEFSFKYAVSHGYHRLTLADKPNVLRESSDRVRSYFESVASKYPEIEADIQNVDAIALWMVRSPERFGVIVAENMFGDILSDLGAALVGGLGVAPSGNYGCRTAYFEPVHGSAPRHSGKNKANPMAMFLTIAEMAEYLQEREVALLIRQTVMELMQQGQVTADLGGSLSTSQVTDRAVQVVKENK